MQLKDAELKIFVHRSYRKALRMMRYADHHGFPIITFIDTPGAFADLKSEELGQVSVISVFSYCGRFINVYVYELFDSG